MILEASTEFFVKNAFQQGSSWYIYLETYWWKGGGQREENNFVVCSYRNVIAVELLA